MHDRGDAVYEVWKFSCRELRAVQAYRLCGRLNDPRVRVHVMVRRVMVRMSRWKLQAVFVVERSEFRGGLPKHSGLGLVLTVPSLLL